MKKPEFVSIGDITTDAFIRIGQASVYHDDDANEDKLCLTNGSKIPYEFAKIIAAVGNSPNAATSAAKFGLHSALATNMGDDEHGKEDLETLKKNGIDTQFVKIHPGKVSNYHYVLWHKAERTILIKHEEYDYKLPDIGEPPWAYFSSVGENSIDYHHEIAAYLKEHPSIKLAFQPGTFQIKLGHEKLKDLYAVTEVFFCNVEEARRILNADENEAPKNLPKMMSKLGPKIAVVTDGPKGAYIYDNDKTWFMPPYPDPAPPYERTGAGDSFSSTFTVALGLGLSIEDAMKWGPINSMSVVQKIGAQEGLVTRDELEQYLKDAPEDYFPVEA